MLSLRPIETPAAGGSSDRAASGESGPFSTIPVGEVFEHLDARHVRLIGTGEVIECMALRATPANN